MTLLVDSAFLEVIKVNEVISVGPQSIGLEEEETRDVEAQGKEYCQAR